METTNKPTGSKTTSTIIVEIEQNEQITKTRPNVETESIINNSDNIVPKTDATILESVPTVETTITPLPSRPTTLVAQLPENKSEPDPLLTNTENKQNNIDKKT